MSFTFLRGLGVGCAVSSAAIFGFQGMLSTPFQHSETSVENNREEEIALAGIPTSNGVERVLSNHILYYSHEKKIPLWVQEHLTATNYEGNASRNDISFKSDMEIDELWRSHPKDYHSSGWSRGHMAPAANHKTSLADMEDTFLLSNIVPQNVDNNANYWARLEFHCRKLVDKYRNVWITSGPAFLPVTKDEKHFMHYEVIGKSKVAVPTHLYKVIHTDDEGGQKYVGAFLVPNAPIPPGDELKEYKVPLETLEQMVGFKFYDKLNRDSLLDLCDNNGCNMISDSDFRDVILIKRIRRANSIEKLDRLWRKTKKESPYAAELLEAYEKKQQQLQENSKESTPVEVAAVAA